MQSSGQIEDRDPIFIDFQLSFSTADDQRMIFVFPTDPDAEQVVEPRTDYVDLAPAPSADSDEGDLGPPPAWLTEVRRLAVVNGEMVDLDSGTPPGAVLLDSNASILRLGDG